MVLSSQADSEGIAGACAQKAFSGKLLFLHKGDTFRVGFPLRRLPAEQQGPGSQRQPSPYLQSVDQRARREKGKHGVAEQRSIGAVFCSPRRVYLSRMQLAEWNFEPWVR